MNPDSEEYDDTPDSPIAVSASHSRKAEAFSYPKRLYPATLGTTLKEIEAVTCAIEHGLDPNTLWTEEVLVETISKGGCVMPSRPRDSGTWPHWNTPLHRAIKFSDFESAHFLLQHGADVNLYNAVGKTPLHEAVWNEDYDAIRFLLDHKADMNNFTLGACIRYKDEGKDICGSAGELSIQRALSFSDFTSVQLLVEAGVDLCPPSQFPWTALDLALLYGDRRITAFLLTQGCQLSMGGPTSFNAVYQDSTRELLAFSRDSNIVPPRELYEAHCFVLAKIDQATAIDVEILIRRYFDALHETSNDTSSNKYIRICASCQDFQLGFKSVYETENRFSFDLHPSRKHLIDSASNGCSICAMIADALDHRESDPRSSNQGFGRQVGPKSDAVRLQPAMSGVDLHCMPVFCGELDTIIEVFRINDSLISAFENDYQMDTNTGSSSAMVTARKWIRICQENHSECQEAHINRQRKDIMPRRLLQVGTSDTHVRIVSVKDTVPYCALSYCWGAKDFFITKRDNLAQNMSGIPMASFPAIMQDAVSVVRSLGYEYIWIDALCIIQDDEQDWIHEAAIMGDVYSNAELTISTLVSSDCHTGLFQPRSVRVAYPVPLDVWQPKIGRQANTSQVLVPEWLQGDMKTHGHVHSRGWTLQEQLLSTRILYFGGGMLHFECLHDYVVEANPGGEIRRRFNHDDELEKRRDTKNALQGVVTTRNTRPFRIHEKTPSFELWKQQVEEFTRRSLTKASDRLPAFNAISKSLSRAIGCNPLCGIWDGEKLLESLCWKTKNRLPTPTSSPGIPSWTWIAGTGEISFGLTNRDGRDSVQTSSGATVVSINTEVTGLSITLKGTLHRKQCLHDLLLEHWKILATKRKYKSGVYLDYNIGDDRDIYTFDTLRFPEGPPYKGYGYPRWPNGRNAETLKVLLQKVDNRLNTFRRIGIGLIIEEHSSTRRRPKYVHKDGMIPVPCIDLGMTPDNWLKIDEETFIDQQFTLI
ncbi:heterokaryon incompatibility [Fusarium sporotrichioides]|uniref:Heterokaryon incompatibility n=1 Tax=Fusarium sporotrichioides TaxID=5514 RepID=A0A395SR76_FUSSP|nr:heterokaryon incompatibility [Fusarium sporotrichioides]